MGFSEEQIKVIKEQIFNQIKEFPIEKQEQIKQFISSLNSEQLEKFLIENKLVKESNESGTENCLFCSIINKKIPSTQIYEDSDHICILEINPMSSGHSLLLPKKHIEKIKDLKKETKILAEKIAEIIIKKLETKEFKILESDDFGHAVINIIPIYKNEKIGERKKAEIKDLQKIAEKIGQIRIKEEKPKKEENKDDLKEEKTEPKINIIKLSRKIP